VDTVLEKNDFSKLLQVSQIFIKEYGFKQILIQQFSSYRNKEIWLSNPNDPNFQMIRVTLVEARQFYFDKERIDTYIDFMKKAMNMEIHFLDIHISREPFDEQLEEYSHINLEENYLAGYDLKNIYPDLLMAFDENHIKELSSQIQKQLENNRENYNKTLNRKQIATFVIMLICIILYLFTIILERKYTSSSVYVLLGADYMTFTLGLKQFYRFFTTAFLHGSFLHLFTNLYSFYFLGSFIEKRYGTLKFLLILSVSILCGSLSNAIFSRNTLSVGLSGGIYGLMCIFFIDCISSKRIPLQTLMPLLIVNLAINFLPSTAWRAHLGGMIGAYAVYFCLNSKRKVGPILLLVALLWCLLLKYLTIKTIQPFYPGTDMEVIRILEDLGFSTYSEKLWLQLMKVYTKFGG